MIANLGQITIEPTIEQGIRILNGNQLVLNSQLFGGIDPFGHSKGCLIGKSDVSNLSFVNQILESRCGFLNSDRILSLVVMFEFGLTKDRLQ